MIPQSGDLIRGFVSTQQKGASTEFHRGPYRILLVDDDERMCDFIEEILDGCEGISIIGRAANGKEAVDLATRRLPDVILMDVNMPVLDGITATYSIKEQLPSTVVICLTQAFTPSLYSSMRTAGAAAFLCKNEVLALPDFIMSTLDQSQNGSFALDSRLN